jgi:hypothetical protein
VPPGRYSRCVEAVTELYEKWHAAEPDKGYDAKAAEWRANLEGFRATTQPGSAPSQPATKSDSPRPAESQ